MSYMNFSHKDRQIGVYSTFAVFILLVVYAITTALGFLSLKSPLEQIGDPYFSLMEILIIILSPLLVVVVNKAKSSQVLRSRVINQREE